MSVAVIFGGNGFIGSFFAEYLISKENYSKVYLYDIEEQSKKNLVTERNFLNLILISSIFMEMLEMKYLGCPVRRLI